MKSIEIFNETNSNLNKAVNMAFEVTLRRIEEASLVIRLRIPSVIVTYYQFHGGEQ